MDMWLSCSEKTHLSETERGKKCVKIVFPIPTGPILTGWEANLTWQIMGLSLMVCKMHLRVKSIGDKSSINTANISHPYAPMLSPSSASVPSWLHPPGRYSADVWLHPQSSHWLLFFFSTRWLNQKTFSEKKKEDWRFFRKTIRGTEESIGLSLPEFLKSFVANHERWPHYFSLMSCHTWQKCDMENTRRLSVSICSFPSVPSSLLGLHGIRAGGGGRGRDRVQRRCRFITDQKESGETFTKHPDSLPFYLRDRLMKQMATCWFFACSGNGKRLRRKEWERENRKKAFSSTSSCFSNLCHGRKSKSQLLWSMPPRELSFVLLYPVCSGTSLESKS